MTAKDLFAKYFSREKSTVLKLYKRPSVDFSLRLLFRHLLYILQDPIHQMRRSVKLSWQTALAMQLSLGILTGLLAGGIGPANPLTPQAALPLSLRLFFMGFLIFPGLMVFACASITLFLYYYFRALKGRNLEMQKLNGLVTVALAPFLSLHALSGFLAPLDLLGFAFSCVLLTVGLTEQFSLPKKQILGLGSIAFLLFFSLWSLFQFATT